jgi:hypothetical protein
VIVVLTLALGIGAGTMIFSVIDGVLVRPLPYPEPEGIVRVFQINDEGYDRVNPSDPNFADLKEQMHSFAAFAQFTTLPQPVVGGSEAARLEVARRGATLARHRCRSGLLPPDELPKSIPWSLCVRSRSLRMARVPCMCSAG